MRILYVGHHFQKNNDDEGAIYKALSDLGHDVFRISPSKSIYAKNDFDFVLFHNVEERYINILKKRFPIVMWYFDPIDKGFRNNDAYIASVLPYLDLAFFTDGDFVRSQSTSHIIDLKQGLDEIDMPIVNKDVRVEETRDLLFIGTVSIPGYGDRLEHIRLLEECFGPISHTQYSIFKSNLTKACLSSKIMLGMPPVTNHYWSNRVYLLCGRGACLLHPYSKDLYKEFGDHIAMYRSPSEAIEKAKILLLDDDARMQMRVGAQYLVLNNHRYIDRCEELIEHVRQKQGGFRK